MKLHFVQWGVLLLSLFPCDDAFSQFVFEQDIVQGGITAAGFSTGQGSGSGSFDIFIEPGSTIKKAYIFSYTMVNPPFINFNLNDNIFSFSPSNSITNFTHTNSWASPVSVFYKDITNYISPQELIYDVTIPLQPNLQINEGFWTLFLIVVYENEELNNTAYTIIVNDKDLIGNEEYEMLGLNSINSFNPVGYSLYTDRSGDGFTENNKIYFNSNLLGIIGGSDNVNSLWNGAGVKGHFYYQNNELFGLDDDIANNTMSGTDGLADVSEYLDNNATSCTFQLRHINYPFQNPASTNLNLAYTLAYTTPCQPFETTLTEEVETCRGDTAQLLATGGQSYEWLPAEDLSCYNCPNPVFVGDSSKIYTVRIWNTDSCSKVLPVKVNVLDAPHNANLSTTAATCSLEDGVLSINGVSGGQSPYYYNIGGNWITNPTAPLFSALEAGDYTFTVRDQNHCYYSQDFTIEETNPAHAAFTANPESGTEPLEVDFYNQSSGTTHYEWMLLDSTFNSFEFDFTFDSAGNYPVQLIAWNYEPHCADTAMATIIVNPAPPDYSHSIFMPTLHNPQNGDFLVKTTNVQRVEFDLYNTIGQQILSTEREVNDGVNGLFNGSHLARGYYFFRLKYWDVQGLEYKERGKVLLMR